MKLAVDDTKREELNLMNVDSGEDEDGPVVSNERG
jgi:hypothetical protein